MSEDNISHTLEVPGARLYYETKGTGPLILFIPGANGDNNVFLPVRQYLTQHYTVVTYDRRGFSKSELLGEQDYEHRLETDADDVRRLVEHLSNQPATIFGSSSGAIVALTVLVRHPTVVKTLIAHEPPLLKLLPDWKKWEKYFLDVYDTYKKYGVPEGVKHFVSEITAGDDAKAMQGHDELGLKNKIYWFENELRQYPPTEIDLDSLRVQSNKLILACGKDTGNHLLFPYLPNSNLAKLLNKDILLLPGGHIGYLFHPEHFARELIEGLSTKKSKL